MDAFDVEIVIEFDLAATVGYKLITITITIMITIDLVDEVD